MHANVFTSYTSLFQFSFLFRTYICLKTVCASLTRLKRNTEVNLTFHVIYFKFNPELKIVTTNLIHFFNWFCTEEYSYWLRNVQIYPKIWLSHNKKISICSLRNPNFKWEVVSIWKSKNTQFLDLIDKVWHLHALNGQAIVYERGHRIIPKIPTRGIKQRFTPVLGRP